jgi:hypothetical protein
VVRQLQPGWAMAGIRNRLRDAAGGCLISCADDQHNQGVVVAFPTKMTLPPAPLPLRGP